MTSSVNRLRVDQSLDTRGLPNPDNYHAAVKQLQGMADQDILELHIDDGQALEALPFALRADGHEILVSEPALQGVRLLVRKRSAIVEEK